MSDRIILITLYVVGILVFIGFVWSCVWFIRTTNDERAVYNKAKQACEQKVCERGRSEYLYRNGLNQCVCIMPNE